MGEPSYPTACNISSPTGCFRALLCCPCESNRFVHQVTFPAPQQSLQAYIEPLLLKKDFKWLTINPFAKNLKDTDKIPALHIKSPQRSSKGRHFTVIYSHGNGEEIISEEPIIRAMSKQGKFDVLLYDYPGYSISQFTASKPNSKVTPTEKKCNLAIEAAFRYLVNDQNVDPREIIVWGRSIGSGPTVHLASLKTVKGVPPERSPQNLAGVFLISPILSTLRAVFGTKMAHCCFCFDKFANHAKIKTVNAPVAIMHAKDDEVVKFWNGETLSSKVVKNGFEPLFMNDGGHNDIEYDLIFEHLLKFMEFLRKEPIEEIEAIDPSFSPVLSSTAAPTLREFYLKMVTKIIKPDDDLTAQQD